MWGERETTQLEKIVLCLFPEMCQKGHNSIRENGILFISWNCVKREIAQLKKIVLCLFPEICVKGDSLIRENSIMLISRYVWEGRQLN